MIAAAITNPVGVAAFAAIVIATVILVAVVAVLDRLLPDGELPTEETP